MMVTQEIATTMPMTALATSTGDTSTLLWSELSSEAWWEWLVRLYRSIRTKREDTELAELGRRARRAPSSSVPAALCVVHL